MPPKKQISLFNDLFENPRFSAVFQFYAGITKLRVERTILSKVPRALRRTPVSIMDLVEKIVDDDNNFVSLLNCLYESEDPTLVEFVANLKQGIALYRCTLSPLDCLSLGYFLSLVCTTTSKPYSVRLNCCSVGDQGCKLLSKGLLKNLTRPFSNVTAHLELYITIDVISELGVSFLSELISTTSLLRVLDLDAIEIKAAGFQNICKALSTNTSLEELHLSSCSIGTNMQVAAIREYLEKNYSLKVLSLPENSIRDGSVFLALNGLEMLNLSWNRGIDFRQFAEALKIHQMLKNLRLVGCGLTDASVEELCPGLNNHLEEINIICNNYTVQYGLKRLLKHLSTLTNFKLLILPKRFEQCVSECWAEVRENEDSPNFSSEFLQCIYPILQLLCAHARSPPFK